MRKWLPITACLALACAPLAGARAARARQASASAASTASAKPKTAGHKKRHHARRQPTQKAPTADRISEIQSALAREGYYQSDPNGRWDSNTVAALEKFQSASGIDATGKLDAPTLQKLGLGSDIAGVSAPRPLMPSCCALSPSAPAPAATPAPSAQPAGPPPAAAANPPASASTTPSADTKQQQ